jgi:Stage II sporulation protein E (SpoIIE)
MFARATLRSRPFTTRVRRAVHRPALWTSRFRARPESTSEPRDHLISLLVIAGIAAVAYADHIVVSVSLAYLYFLPLALTSLIHRLRTNLVLVLVCVFLSDLFGPPDHSGWPHVVRIVLTAAGFTMAVLFVNQLTRQRTVLARVVDAQSRELAQEIELAVQAQRKLLPQRLPRVSGFEIAARTYPAKAVGGDLYDFIDVATGKLGIEVADVSGKGVSAGLFMPSAKGALRTTLDQGSSIEQVVARANQIIYELTDDVPTRHAL